MAQIIYYKNPIDELDVHSFVSKGTLRYALREIGKENSPLCVTINGMTPDELDLDTILDDTDIVEIRGMVHGGGENSSNKRTIATVIQIAALIAVSSTGVGAIGASAIIIGGSIAAGALNKWANDLDAANNSRADTQDIAQQVSEYSPRNAANKARPLSPMPLPLGSHRYAPDVHVDVYKSRYGMEQDGDQLDPYLFSFNPGIISSNGPMASENSWITMPANFIASGFPLYPIKIAPYSFTLKTENLTPSEELDILNIIRARVLNEAAANFNARTSWTYYGADLGLNNVAFPLIIYHFDNSDPYRGRFNFFFSIQRVHQLCNKYSPSRTASQRWTDLGGVFSGSALKTSDHGYSYFFSPDVSGQQNPLTEVHPLFSNRRIPAGMPVSSRDAAVDFFQSYMLIINGGSYTTSEKTTVSNSQSYILGWGIIQSYPGIPISTQIFNYGIGDIDILDRKVGSSEILGFTDQSGISEVNKDSPFINVRWGIPDIYVPNRIGNVIFNNNVMNFPDKQLINPGVFNGYIEGSDQGPYNFIYYDSKIGLDFFRFWISGRLYRTTSSGFAKNSTRFQVQWKWDDQIDWTDATVPINTVVNGGTNTIHIQWEVRPSFDEVRITKNFLKIRIRKANLDSSDNKDDKISELSISNACFIPSPTSIVLNESYLKNAPMNIEGLYTTGLITDSSVTNQFSALVESKCWVFDFDSETWVWTKNRNPAFWFLYYARGGFLNNTAQGQMSWPYSPTYGWVNYPGHPHNTDHIFGGGYSDDEIDIDKILEWAYFCEEENLKIDMVVRDDTSVADILERIANIGRASVTYAIGKLSVVIEDPRQIPVSIFGMGNIIYNSFSVDYNIGDPIRKVVGTFTNRESWEQEEVSSLVPFSSEDNVRELSITLDGITDKEQAQREINILAARQFYQKRTYNWETDTQGFLAKRGDIVLLSHDSTQYGYSGVVKEFVIVGSSVLGIKTGSIIDGDVKYVTIKTPDNELITLECRFENDMIVFEEEYPIEKAPFYISENFENLNSEFDKTFPEDFTFISDIKNTTGKKVRISQVEATGEGKFKFTAVDEDSSLWSHEYDEIISNDSFNDSNIVAKVINLESSDLGNGKIKLSWENVNCDSVQVVNMNTNAPFEVNGSYSIYGKEIVLDIIQGLKYKLSVKPLTYVPTTKKDALIEVWPL